MNLAQNIHTPLENYEKEYMLPETNCPAKGNMGILSWLHFQLRQQEVPDLVQVKVRHVHVDEGCPVILFVWERSNSSLMLGLVQLLKIKIRC